MASSSDSDNDDSTKRKIDDWQESSQVTSSPTDNSKQVSGTDAEFLENSNSVDQHHEDEYFEEAEDWMNVNNRLKQHGFRSIRPIPPGQVIEVQSGVFFDEAEAHMLRNTIEKLLDDCERRQALVQELITSSNKLQEEVNEKSDKAYRYDREVGRLRKELKSQQAQIQELEQKRLEEVRNHGEEMQATSIAKSDLHAKCELLEKKCVEMEQENVELRYQNQQLLSRERERPARESTFPKHNFGKDDSNSQDTTEKDSDDNHTPRSYTATSERGDGTRTPIKFESTPETLPDDNVLQGTASKTDLMPNSKFLQKKLKTTERHVEESKKLIDLLEDENNKLKAELTKRPGLDEWRKAWKYNKKLERILLENNLSISSRRAVREMNEKKKSLKHKTHVKDIDFLPIDVCRKYIKRICTRLNITDLKEIYSVLDCFVSLGETQRRMEQLIRRILQVIDVKNAPYQLLDDISDSTEPRDHSIYCEKAWKLILPTLKKWSREIKNLKELKNEITRLSENLFPWKSHEDLFAEASDDVSVDDLRKALDKMTMSDDRAKASELRGDCPVSMEQLQSIVAHFQKLFDVKSILGIFPRMNEVYSRVGEMQNVMKTIIETLDLAPNANSVEIVNAIGKIQTARHYLKFQDLPGILKRLEEYDEFFLAFQSLVSQLYDLLGVDKMDEILTAVKALIHFPQK